MKKILIAAIVITIVQSVAAQKDFRDGFVITNDGDSIIGKIDYRSNGKSYKSCVFLSEDDVKEYFPGEIQRYGYIGDKLFEGSIIDSVFVETVVGGLLNLYRYKSFYYIKKKGGQVQILQQEFDYKEEFKKTDVQKDNRNWLQKVSNVIVDCIYDPNEVIVELKLNEKSLTELVTKYNNCRGANNIVYKERKKSLMANYGIGLGLTSSDINKSNRAFNNALRKVADNYSSSAIHIGLIVNLSSPRLSENFSFQQELVYRSLDYSSNVDLPFAGNEESHFSEITKSSISIPFSVMFKTFGEKVNYFFLIGASPEILSGSETSLTSEITDFEGNTEVRTGEVFEFRSFTMSPLIGLGSFYNFSNYRVGLQARYTPSASLNVSMLSLEMQNNQVEFSIIFMTNRK